MQPQPPRETFNTDSSLPTDPLLQMLCSAASKYPERTAVIDSLGAHDYQETFTQSRRFAAALRNAGVHPNSVVALSMRKEFSYIQAVLGCLLAGNAFLPIDPSYPLERRRYMIADTGVAAVATNFDMDSPADARIRLDIRCLPTGAAATTDYADRLLAAYTIYTSGTTGRPKGVPITSTALAKFIVEQGAALRVTSDSRFASVSSISFDMSIWEIFMALCHASTIVMLDRDTILDGRKLGAALKAHEISHVLMTPSMLAALPDDDYPALRQVVSAGEKCSVRTVKTWSRAANFFDAYGATEATIYTTLMRKSPDTPLSCIGLPMHGAEIVILDMNREEVEQGEIGEIFIVGDAVSPGYHNLPDLNARVFSEHNGKRAYRTGDLGYKDKSGYLFYRGRTDRQVKFNGHRIELEEIERVSNTTEFVSGSAATLYQSKAGKTFLYLFVVTNEKTEFVPHAFREALRKVLPTFMIPNRIFAVPAMPMNASGKADIPLLLATTEAAP